MLEMDDFITEEIKRYFNSKRDLLGLLNCRCYVNNFPDLSEFKIRPIFSFLIWFKDILEIVRTGKIIEMCVKVEKSLVKELCNNLNEAYIKKITPYFLDVCAKKADFVLIDYKWFWDLMAKLKVDFIEVGSLRYFVTSKGLFVNTLPYIDLKDSALFLKDIETICVPKVFMEKDRIEAMLQFFIKLDEKNSFVLKRGV